MSLDPLGPVTIGAREIYDLLLRTNRQVDQIDGKVEQVATAHAATVTDLADHEGRIRALERARWPLPSMAAIIALASLILAVLSYARGG